MCVFKLVIRRSRHVHRMPHGALTEPRNHYPDIDFDWLASIDLSTVSGIMRLKSIKRKRTLVLSYFFSVCNLFTRSGNIALLMTLVTFVGKEMYSYILVCLKFSFVFSFKILILLSHEQSELQIFKRWFISRIV